MEPVLLYHRQKTLIKDKFIVMNADDFFSKRDIKKCLKHRYCILVKEMKNLANFGHVMPSRDKKYTVFEIKEKPREIEGLAYTGLVCF